MIEKLKETIADDSAALKVIYGIKDAKVACQMILDDPLTLEGTWEKVNHWVKNSTALFGNDGVMAPSATTPKNVEKGPVIEKTIEYGDTSPAIDQIIKESGDAEDVELRGLPEPPEKTPPESETPPPGVGEGQVTQVIDKVLDQQQQEQGAPEVGADVLGLENPKERAEEEAENRNQVKTTSYEATMLASLKNKGWKVETKLKNHIIVQKGYSKVSGKDVRDLVGKMNKMNLFNKKAKHSKGQTVLLNAGEAKGAKALIMSSDAFSGYQVVVTQEDHPKIGQAYQVPEKVLDEYKETITAKEPPTLPSSSPPPPSPSPSPKKATKTASAPPPSDATQRIINEAFGGEELGSDANDMHVLMQGERRENNGMGDMGIPEDRSGESDEIDVEGRIQKHKEKTGEEEFDKKKLASSNLRLIEASGEGRRVSGVISKVSAPTAVVKAPPVTEAAVLASLSQVLGREATPADLELLRAKQPVEPPPTPELVTGPPPTPELVTGPPPTPELVTGPPPASEVAPEPPPVEETNGKVPHGKVYASLLVNTKKISVPFSSGEDYIKAKVAAKANHKPFTKLVELKEALTKEEFTIEDDRNHIFQVIGDEGRVAQILRDFKLPPDSSRALGYFYGTGVKVEISKKDDLFDKKQGTTTKSLSGDRMEVRLDSGETRLYPFYNLKRA